MYLDIRPDESSDTSNRIFRFSDLPTEVDPVNVDATVSDGIREGKLLKMGSGKKVPVRAKSATA
jgi:hypothetical protein